MQWRAVSGKVSGGGRQAVARAVAAGKWVWPAVGGGKGQRCNHVLAELH